MDMYYDWDGQSITQEQWGELFEQERHVGHDRVYGIEVSTVYLGINHQFGEGPPPIFETMIFGGLMDGDTWRYSAREEALAGHQAAVSLVKEAAATALRETKEAMERSR